MNRRNWRWFTSVFAVVLVGVFVPKAQATTVTWTASSGTWTIGSNWSNQAAPSSGFDYLAIGSSAVLSYPDSAPNVSTSAIFAGNSLTLTNSAELLLFEVNNVGNGVTFATSTFNILSLNNASIVGQTSQSWDTNVIDSPNAISLSGADTFSIVDQSSNTNAMTINTALTGTGSLAVIKNNGGTSNFALSGSLSNSGYSGNITMSGSTTHLLNVTIGNSGGWGSGNLTLNGLLSLASTTSFNELASGLILNSASNTVTFTSSGTIGSLSGVSGSSLVLSSPITLAGSRSTTFSGVISGTSALVNSGTSVLTLAGSNTYSGGTTISGGTLNIAAVGALSSTGALSIGNGLLNLSSYSGTVGAATMTGGTISGTSGGTLTGTSLNINAAGVATISGANAVFGATTITSGSLAVGSAGTVLGSVTINPGAVLDVSALTGGYTFSSGTLTAGRISSPSTDIKGSLTVQNAAISPTASGTLSISGSLGLSNGTLAYVSGDQISVGSGLAFSGTDYVIPNATLGNGTFTLFTYNGTLSNSGDLVMGGAYGTNPRQTYMFGSTAGGTVLTLTVSGSAGNLNWTGTGSGVWYTGTNSTANWYNTGNNSSDYFYAGDNVNFSDSGSTPQSVTISGAVSPGSVTVSNTAVNYTISGGSITGFTSLVKNGPGTLTLAQNNSYTGGTMINGGVIALGTNNALPVAGTLTLGTSDGSGTFDLAGLNQQLAGLAIGSGATAASQIIGNSAVSTTSTLTYSNSGGSNTFGGTIQDGIGGIGGLVAVTVTAGKLNLDGSNTYSGVTTVQGGTLQIGSSTALYAGAAVGNLVDNGTLDLAGNVAGVGGLSGSGAVVNSISSGTLTFGKNNASNTFAGSFLGSTLSLIKTGTGTIAVTGTNNSGSTVVSQGTLQIGNALVNGGLGSSAYTIASGADLYLNYATAVVDTSGTWSNTMVGGGTLELNSAQGGNGNAKWGPNSATPTVFNSGFTGTLQIDAGRMDGAPTNLGGLSNIIVNPTGQFLAWSGTYTMPISIAGTGDGEAGEPGALRAAATAIATWAGPITLTANANIQAQTNGANFTLTGPISGPYQCNFFSQTNATLTVAPSGAVQNSYASTDVTGAGFVIAGNQYAFSTGPLLMSGGSLKLNGNSFSFSNLSGGSGSIQNGSASLPSTLTVGSDNTNTIYSGTLINGATASVALVKTGSGTLTLNGNNTATGGTTISAGVLQLGDGVSNNGTVAGNIINNSSIVFANPFNLPFGGSISGSGSVTKTGAGTLYLTGNQTYTGPTVISAGTVRLGGLASFGGNGSGFTVNNSVITSTPIASDVLTLTDGGATQDEARSAFYNGQVSPVNGFTTNFTYTPSSGTGTADGVAFMLQNDPRGTAALGSFGFNLGYGSAATVSAISPSIGISLNLYNNVSQVGFVSGGIVYPYTTITGGINLHNGDPINVAVNYNAQTEVVLVTLTDAFSPSLTFSTSESAINLQSVFSGTGAFIGFSGGDGAATSTQTISNFSYTPSSVNNILPAGTALSLAAAATLDLYGGNQTVASMTGSGSVTNTNSSTISTLTVGGDNSSQTFYGVLQDGGGSLGLSKIGGGSLLLTNANPYSGGTYVGGGTLQLGISASIGTGGLTVNSGVVDLAGNSPSIVSLSGSAGVVTNSGSSVATLDLVGPSAGTFSGSLRDGAAQVALQLDGTTLRLAGVNTYSGTTTINTGSLVAGSANALSPSSPVILNGGLLDVTAGPQTVSSLTVSGGALNLQLGNLLTATGLSSLTGGTLNLFGATGSSLQLISFPSTFSGSFSLVTGLTSYESLLYTSTALDLLYTAPPGPATWNISTSGSWANGLNWSAGVSPSGVGATAVMGTVPSTTTSVSLDSPQTIGTLVFNNSAGYTLTPGSAGSLTLSNSGGLPGLISVLSGSHTIAAPLTLAGTSSMISIVGNGILDITGNVGDLGGGGSLTMSSSDNSGKLVLRGSNNFGGGSTVLSGTLVLDGAASLLAGTSLTIGSGTSPGAVFAPVASTSIGNAATTLAPVPEPGTMALLAIASLFGSGVWWRRIRSSREA